MECGLQVRGRRSAFLALAVCGLLVGGVEATAAAARDFEHPADHAPADAQQQFGVVNAQRNDTPNDPGYDIAEPDDPDSSLNGGPFPASTNFYDEDFGLIGFPSQRTRATAIYTAGPNVGHFQCRASSGNPPTWSAWWCVASTAASFRPVRARKSSTGAASPGSTATALFPSSSIQM